MTNNLQTAARSMSQHLPFGDQWRSRRLRAGQQTCCLAGVIVAAVLA